jgi:hypothetical protein
MTPPDQLIERADSLMQRKRVFVAGAPSAPLKTDLATMDDEDLPVLTEIVDISEVSGDAPNAAARQAMDPLADAVTQEFALQLQQRFASELPGLIDQATAKLAIELQQAVQRIAEQCLRDFVAQRRQLPLPLSNHATERAE